jgi:hypothetical protein
VAAAEPRVLPADAVPPLLSRLLDASGEVLGGTDLRAAAATLGWPVVEDYDDSLVCDAGTGVADGFGELATDDTGRIVTVAVSATDLVPGGTAGEAVLRTALSDLTGAVTQVLGPPTGLRPGEHAEVSWEPRPGVTVRLERGIGAIDLIVADRAYLAGRAEDAAAAEEPAFEDDEP